jgi:type IV pilus assembly protein PilN
MIRINLLALRDAQRALGRRQQLSVAVLSVAVAILVMLVPYLVQSRKMARLDGDIDQLRSEIQKYNEQAKEVRDLDKKRTDLQAKLKVIADLKQKRVGPVHILADLSVATPEKLWLVDFSDVNSQATITGMALDNQTIATFMRQLQSSKYFFDVDLVETSQSEPIRGVLAGDNGVVFKRFIVKAHLDYLGMGGKPPPPPDAAAAKTGA